MVLGYKMWIGVSVLSIPSILSILSRQELIDVITSTRHVARRKEQGLLLVNAQLSKRNCQSPGCITWARVAVKLLGIKWSYLASPCLVSGHLIIHFILLIFNPICCWLNAISLLVQSWFNPLPGLGNPNCWSTPHFCWLNGSK